MKTEAKVYVTVVSSAIIQVKVVDSSIISALKEIGFGLDMSGDLGQFQRGTSSPIEQAELLSRLRDAQVCFSAGNGWSPAAVFEYLRDQGMISGKYRRISWRGPNQLFVEEEC